MSGTIGERERRGRRPGSPAARNQTNKSTRVHVCHAQIHVLEKATICGWFSLFHYTLILGWSTDQVCLLFTVPPERPCQRMRGLGVDPGFDIWNDPIEEDDPPPRANPPIRPPEYQNMSATSRASHRNSIREQSLGTSQPTGRSRGSRPSSSQRTRGSQSYAILFAKVAQFGRDPRSSHLLSFSATTWLVLATRGDCLP